MVRISLTCTALLVLSSLMVPACSRASRESATQEPAGETASAAPPATPVTTPSATPTGSTEVPGGTEPAGRTPRELSDEEVSAWVKPSLAKGETLVHPVFVVSVGALGPAAVALVDRDGSLGGLVVTPPGAGGVRRDLPELSQGMLDKVVAVAFMDADSRPGDEIVIMSEQMSGIGPEGAIPQPVNAVVAWDGSEFVRLEDVESAIYDKKTVAEIRAELEARRGATGP